MPPRRVTLGGLIAVGFQTLSLSNSTALALNSTVRNQATVLDISVETNAARYRADGTNPTLSTGVVLQVNNTYRWEGFNGTGLLKFQRATGTSKVSIFGWRHVGDPSRA